MSRAPDRLGPPGNWGRVRRSLHRLSHSHWGHLGQSIPPLDALEDEIDKRIASGESEELFTHAGRPSVGFEPARADVEFVHDRLIRKESNARVGSLLAFAGFIVLLIVIL